MPCPIGKMIVVECQCCLTDQCSAVMGFVKYVLTGGFLSSTEEEEEDPTTALESSPTAQRFFRRMTVQRDQTRHDPGGVSELLTAIWKSHSKPNSARCSWRLVRALAADPSIE